MYTRLIAIFVFMIVLVPMTVQAQDDDACTVTVAADTRILGAPSEDADVLGIITREASFDVFMQAGDDWYRLLTPSGKAGGWVQSGLLTCEALLETAEEQPKLITLNTSGFVTAARVNVRQGPGLSFARLGRVTEGDELNIIAQSDAELPWYLVEHEEFGLVWVRSDLVTLGDLDEDTGLVIITIKDVDLAADGVETSRNSPLNVGSGNGSGPDTPTVDDNATIVGGHWTHTSTLLEHGCTLPDGPQPGSTSVIGFTLTPSADNETVTIRYDTGFSFTLYHGSGRTYSGSYGTAATIRVSMTFDTPVSYTGSETVIHPPNQYRDSECTVRSSWVGRKG